MFLHLCTGIAVIGQSTCKRCSRVWVRPPVTAIEGPRQDGTRTISGSEAREITLWGYAELPT